MSKRSNFRIRWTEGNGVPHEIVVKPGWEESEVDLLVDQINRGAFNLKDDSFIDLSAPPRPADNP